MIRARESQGRLDMYRTIFVACALLVCAAGRADEAREDAWWTGPMLAPAGATLPQGHALIEPYLFDIMSVAHFDTDGNRHSGPYEHDLGSLTYMLYGITDDLTAGLIPRFVYNEPAGAPNSTGIGVGDLTLQAGWALTRFEDGHSIPSSVLVVQETLPTGRYDRLSRPSDGFGAGAYTTALALYSQDYFWMPNGRIVRARLAVTYALSSSVSVHDASVYGTAQDFGGRAYPGDSLTVDAAAEYSMTRNWVLALDLVYQHNGDTRVSGVMGGGATPPGNALPLPYLSYSGSSWSLGYAPAIEYNFSSAVGLLLGVRIINLGRNTTASVTPAIALNMVF
jgi:hypothetical protein